MNNQKHNNFLIKQIKKELIMIITVKISQAVIIKMMIKINLITKTIKIKKV